MFTFQRVNSKWLMPRVPSLHWFPILNAVTVRRLFLSTFPSKSLQTSAWSRQEFLHSRLDLWWQFSVQKCIPVVSGLHGITQWNEVQSHTRSWTLRSNFRRQGNVCWSFAKPQSTRGSRGLWQAAGSCMSPWPSSDLWGWRTGICHWSHSSSAAQRWAHSDPQHQSQAGFHRPSPQESGHRSCNKDTLFQQHSVRKTSRLSDGWAVSHACWLGRSLFSSYLGIN